eukprot:25675-Amphidinium_carterae.2
MINTTLGKLGPTTASSMGTCASALCVHWLSLRRNCHTAFEKALSLTCHSSDGVMGQQSREQKFKTR